MIARGPRTTRRLAAATPLLAATLASPAFSSPVAPEPIRIGRAAGPITIDGELGDEGWQGAAKIEVWYETNPGDNIEPSVKNAAFLAFDDKFLYAAFEFMDPNPGSIRAPYGDRDTIGGGIDFGGLIINPSGDGKTGIEFFANPRGIQYDAIQSDVSGEDSAPDYFWSSSARIHEDRWTLEIRIPFSSLRYPKEGSRPWGIILYRNYPRDRRYQIFSAKLPRDVSCFICNSTPLVGLESLPASAGLVVAPYVAARQESLPSGGTGTSLESEDPEYDGGVDAKWTPNAGTAVDATIRPDFSQIESDVPVISTNERFAIFLPEKRPFFLEGKDLFSLPFNAVYTRTVNDPGWGARITGRQGSTSYTALVASDKGGGLVILPGPNNSQFADEAFESVNMIARARRESGQSFASFLVTDREIDSGGHNRVFGPDFQYRPNPNDWITGQALYSVSKTPDLPDLAAEWDGRDLAGHAATLQWFRGTRTYDITLNGFDIADEFRADLGFIPQVGIREGYGEYGYTFRPKGFLSRVRTFLISDYTADRVGNLVFQEVSPGIGMDGRGNLFMRYRVATDRIEAGDGPIGRTQFIYLIQASPSRVFNALELSGWIGEQIDFDNSRPGHGASVTFLATIRPTDHLAIGLDGEYRYLDVEHGQRLFTAQVEWVKATYTFGPRSFLRLIGQQERTDQNPALYQDPVSEHTGSRSFSALYAYKLNWQTVFFVGYGDEKALTDEDEFVPESRSVFFKVSYAFQR